MSENIPKTCQECEYFYKMPEICNYPKAEHKACNDFVEKEHKK